MKKILSLTIAIMLLGSTTAFAHGHGGGHRGGGSTYYTCNYENCDLDYNHQHDGGNYYGHYYGDGHEYHNSGNGYHC